MCELSACTYYISAALAVCAYQCLSMSERIPLCGSCTISHREGTRGLAEHWGLQRNGQGSKTACAAAHCKKYGYTHHWPTRTWKLQNTLHISCRELCNCMAHKYRTGKLADESNKDMEDETSCRLTDTHETHRRGTRMVKRSGRQGSSFSIYVSPCPSPCHPLSSFSLCCEDTPSCLPPPPRQPLPSVSLSLSLSPSTHI